MRYLFIFLLGSSFAWGQSNPIHLSLERYLVTEQVQDNKTVEVLSKAVELLPGDVIEETLFANNLSDKALGALSLEIPVPLGTYYLSESARALVVAGEIIAPQFSFDSGLSFAYPPLMKKVTVVENGKEVIKEVEVKAEEYTHVRWLVPSLSVDEQVSTMFRARVR